MLLPRALWYRKLLGMNSVTGEDQAGVREVPAQGNVPRDAFAIRLKAIRYDAGDLTIEQAAAKAGQLNQNWSNWEHGVKPRDLDDIVAAISEAFGVDRTWLMYGGPLAKPTTRRDRRGRSKTKPTYSQIGGFPGWGRPFGPAPDATRSSGPGSRPPDRRPAGHPTMFERQAIRDLGWAA